KNQRVPMAGVPHHAAEGYIARLIAKGYKVALCEQVGSETINGLMPREVVRVFTAGTVIEPGMLEARRNNYLVAIAADGQRAGLAYADITTGEFAVTVLEQGRALEEELARLAPAEILLPEGEEIVVTGDTPVSRLPSWRFEEGNARQTLLQHFGVRTLEGFGCEGKPPAIRAAGAILYYLQETQQGAVEQIQRLSTYSLDRYMALDAATRRNLELTESLTGQKGASLLDVLDETVTAMGARLLRQRVSRPLLDVAALEARLDQVEAFVSDALLRAQMRGLLKSLPDLERLANRALSGRATPRDLEQIRIVLEAVPRVADLVAGLEGAPESLQAIGRDLDACPGVAGLLERAITDDAPTNFNKMGVIRPGFSAELDGVVAASEHAREWVANLEPQERERTGIGSLKVGFNKVFGYYLEVTRANSHLVPSDYIRKQTLTNAERYITPELKEYETLILNAEERILEIERRVFTEVCRRVAEDVPRLLETAAALARLDVAAALAEVAANSGYVRPELSDGATLDIEAGRHPVVERTLHRERFVPNDICMPAGERIQIITGPNMSGKSTILRQVALITL
ncbi:MAG: DNA mismatch repair protein MutS, partial [Chloroflexi bacterium]|nr:DNA mismatch repair protein MutS [Chloroflexota bacterium]